MEHNQELLKLAREQLPASGEFLVLYHNPAISHVESFEFTRCMHACIQSLAGRETPTFEQRLAAPPRSNISVHACQGRRPANTVVKDGSWRPLLPGGAFINDVRISLLSLLLLSYLSVCILFGLNFRVITKAEYTVFGIHATYRFAYFGPYLNADIIYGWSPTSIGKTPPSNVSRDGLLLLSCFQNHFLDWRQRRTTSSIIQVLPPGGRG